MNMMPDPASFTDDLGEAVRSTALLADVTISVWSAEVTDPEILKKIKEDAGAVGNVGKVVKNLLAGVDGPLKDTRSAYSAVRTLHYSLTLPWVADPHATRMTGPRLLPTMLFERYMGEMSAAARKAREQLDAFVEAYPDLVSRAQENLGTLASAIEYPTAEQVRRMFRAGFDLSPIPSGQAFRGLPDATVSKLARALETKQNRMIDGAQRAMWTEVRERIGHLAEKLADPEARFKTSTVAAVKDLVSLLPGWNVTGAPQVAEIVADVQDMLRGIEVKDLRDDMTIRGQVATQARSVVDKLTAYGL